MSNIFNDRTDTELNERTINFQNLSVLDNTIPVLGVGNVVSGQVAGIAGLDLISKETLDDIKDDVIGTRLKNLSSATISTESVATINGDVVGSTPILQGGKDILNQTSIGAIRTLLLENTEEAVVIKPTDGNNEINFHTNIGPPPAVPDGTNLRLQITDNSTFVHNTLETDDIKVDNAKKIISNNYSYRDDALNPIYLTFDSQHAHFTPPDGIRLNQQFQIDSDNGSSATHLFTTSGNKPIHYTTKGTGNHVFYTNGNNNGENATEILNIKPDSIDCNKIIKTIATEGQKIHWDTTSWVYTSAGQVHYYTSNRETLFWGQGVYGMKIKSNQILIQHPLTIASSISTNDTTPMDFYGQKFRFFTPGPGATDVKTLEITANIFDCWYADLRVFGNDKNLVLGSTNGTPHLKFGYDSTGIQSLIQSLTIPIKIQTNANDSNIELQPHGTGIVNITGALSVSGVITGDLTGNSETATKIASITNSNIVQLDETQTLTNKTLTSPIITGTGAIAGVFTGPLTGNAETSTKIASITNSNIVQLSETQTLTNKTLTSPTITGGTIAGTFTGNVLTTSNNVGSLGEGHKRFKSLYVEDIIKKNSIYYRVVNLPSTPTLYDYTNVYTLAYFYSLPIFIEGATNTYNLSSLSNMTGGQDWTSLETKGMILDLTIVAPITGAFYLKHTSDDGARVFLGESGTTPLTTLLSFGATYPAPATWNNQGATTGYASFSITAGTEYRLRLQYVENSGGASCVFEWNTTSLGATYNSDWSSIIADNDIGNSNKMIDTIYTKTLNSTTLNSTTLYSNTLDFPETLADKVLLYGTSYKIAVSDATIDYVSGGNHRFKIADAERLRIDGNVVVSTNLLPNIDNDRDLGGSSNKWDNIYARTTEINTSDRNQKKEIDYENIDKFADELLNVKPCSYKFIDGKRNHLGLIAQDLENGIFENTGAFIKSPKTKIITETQIVDGMKTNIEKEVEIENEYIYGLRYGELISPLIRLCQKQQEQINQLVSRIDLLENGSGELSFI